MPYILVRKFGKHNGCVAFQTELGPKLVKLKNELEKIAEADRDLEVVVISRPEMYGEYKPYSFVYSKNDLVKKTKNLVAFKF